MIFQRKDVRAYTVTLTVFCDLLAMYVALMVAWWTRFKSGLPLQDTPLFFDYLAAVTLWAITLIAVFQWLGLYNIRMPLPFLAEAARVTQGVFISLGILFALSFFLRAQFRYSRSTVVLMTILSLIWILIIRDRLRRAWGTYLRRHNMLERVLLIGWGDRSVEIVQHVKSDVNSGREIMGVLSDEEPKDLPNNVRWLGKLADTEKILQQHETDEVILGTLQVPHAQISDWILMCEREMVQFRLVPDLFEILASRVHLDFVSGVPLLGLGDFPLDRPFNRAVKRAFDVIGSIVGLILSSVPMALGALFIRLEAPGPIFYMQERCGREGRTFEMAKLRTMKVDAEKESGPVWAKENDPRRTKVGGYMRKFNVDEMPQFWHVLSGEMSLVGPRPERPFFVEKFKDEIKHYMPRHAFKPGLTGWAQVNGLRGNTPLDERVRYDLYYFENWSLWFDIRICIATIFSFKNAY